MAKPWWAETALQVESLYVQHRDKLEKIAAIGHVWGTNVKDLTSPVGVAGRVMRTVPEVLGLVRSFGSEPNTAYAEALLRKELPFRMSEATDTRPMLDLLHGVAAVLGLKTETTPMFYDPNEDKLSAFKVYLGDGIVLGMLKQVEAEGWDFHAPVLSSHEPAEVHAKMAALWAACNGIGIQIRTGPKMSIRISRIAPSDTLVLGSEFANNYVSLAQRIKRFEDAGFKRNLMLLGPPGCGKTTIAQQIARHIGRFTINVDSDILSSSFTDVLTIFFNGIILICDDFDRYKGDTKALLERLEQTNSSLIVTCNTVYGFDKAAIRMGRMDEIIDMPKPDADMRRRLFIHFAEGMPVNDADLETIIEATDGFTPAEMRETVKCFRALDREDAMLEITRIKRHAEMTAEMLYNVNWPGMSQSPITSDATRGYRAHRIRMRAGSEKGDFEDDDFADDDGDLC